MDQRPWWHPTRCFQRGLDEGHAKCGGHYDPRYLRQKHDRHEVKLHHSSEASLIWWDGPISIWKRAQHVRGFFLIGGADEKVGGRGLLRLKNPIYFPKTEILNFSRINSKTCFVPKNPKLKATSSNSESRKLKIRTFSVQIWTRNLFSKSQFSLLNLMFSLPIIVLEPYYLTSLLTTLRARAV